MQPSVIALPFNAFLGLQQAAGPPNLLVLPAGGQYLNHLGTVHASALLALAEATSGEFLIKELGTVERLVPVVRRMESKFRKPAHGAITSSVSTPAEVIAQLRSDLLAKGRALISIDVQLHDESGTHVMSATVEWFLTMMPAESKSA